MSNAFSDLPHDIRFAFITALGEIVGPNHVEFHYGGDYIAIAASRTGQDAIRQLGRRFGFDHAVQHDHYFPLGSDIPADHMRHNCGKYDGYGFRLWMHFCPKRDAR
jgi:hypothetical protein